MYIQINQLHKDILVNTPMHQIHLVSNPILHQDKD